MNNRLSFAQILQKKKNGESSKNSRISAHPRLAQSHFSNEAEFPTLSQMMDQFLQYPNGPQQSFVLSFNQSESYGGNMQDFETGLNALDSFIMTQSYLNAQKVKPRNLPIQLQFGRDKNGVSRVSHEFNLGELSKKYSNVKQNKNVNLGNDNLFKFSTRTYKESLENSQRQFLDDSNKFGPMNPQSYNKPVSNRQMIGNTKIIQSQAYHNIPISESKVEHSNVINKVPKIERSERMDGKEEKLSRYQVNYQQSQRKQQPQPPKQKKKLILSKVNSQKTQAEQKVVDPIPNKMRISKKPSEEQEFLLAGISSAPLVPQVHSQHQKRIEDAKKQISAYLLIRQKQLTTVTDTKPTKPSFSKPADPPQLPAKQCVVLESKKEPNTVVVVNYSFANNGQENMESKGPADSFAHTKKQLKQIEQQRQIQQNQKMLSCIEYTQSQADLEDEDNGVMEYRRNIQASQSIPQKRQPQQESREPFTLQKYIPNPSPGREEVFEKSPESGEQQIVEESQMIQKICVQPSIEQSMEKYEINNSDHPNMERKQSESDFMSERQGDQGEKKQVYHDVSSIDIKLSQGSSSQFCLKAQFPNKDEAMEVVPASAADYHYNSNEPIMIPKLNVSDFESVSNNSMPSPIKSSPQKSPLHQNISQVESNPPLSQNQSLNQDNNYGFIYKMRVHSRNNSFTSNYNSSIHGSQHSEGKDICASSHSSLCIQGAKQEDEGGYNMSKYRLDNKKYEEVDVSISVEIPPVQDTVLEEADPNNQKIAGKAIQQVTPSLVKQQNICEQRQPAQLESQINIQVEISEESMGHQGVSKIPDFIEVSPKQVITPNVEQPQPSPNPKIQHPSNFDECVAKFAEEAQTEIASHPTNYDGPKLSPDPVANQTHNPGIGYPTQISQFEMKIKQEQAQKQIVADEICNKEPDSPPLMKDNNQLQQMDKEQKKQDEYSNHAPPIGTLPQKKLSLEKGWQQAPELKQIKKEMRQSIGCKESQEKPFSFNLDFLDF